MAFFTDAVAAEIKRVARVYYMDRTRARIWNDKRKGEELRSLTGFYWVSRIDSQHRSGFKTRSAAMRDAYYVLLEGREAPSAAASTAPKLRVVRAA